MNLFKRASSLVNAEFENHVLGMRSSEDIFQTSHVIAFPEKEFIAVIGGKITPEKIVAIDTLAGIAKEIHLHGEIGIKFLHTQAMGAEEENRRKIKLIEEKAM